MGKKTALVILDGWGHGSNEKSNAIYCANTPFVDSLYDKYPNTELLTHGEFVGLPKGQMGNSEEAVEDDTGEFDTDIDDIIGEIEREARMAQPKEEKTVQ